MNLWNKAKQLAYTAKEKVQSTYQSAKTFLVGLGTAGLATLAAPKAQAVPPTPASITTDLQGVMTSASGIFETVVPIVVGVCALAILIYMIKKVKTQS